MTMTSNSNQINLQVPQIFAPLFTAPKRKNILYGGRGSAKSHTAAEYCLIRARQRKELVLCTRELQNSIAESVHALLKNKIEELNMQDFFTVQRDTILGANGSKFIFKGVRSNVNEIKSMEGVTICWVEEAQAMSQQSLDVLIPTIRAPGSILIFTFNPFKDSDPVYVMSQKPDEDTLIIHANFSDNPFFPDALRREMELCKRTDYDKYLWVWEGQCLGISAAQIFRGKYTVKRFDTPPGAILKYGGDWGFANDPSTIIRSFIIGNSLYIDQAAGGVHIEIEALPALYDRVDGTRLYPIYADNSRPETIDWMQGKGFNVLPSDKGVPVEDGVEYLRSFEQIYLHSDLPPEVKEEFDLYQYKVDPQTGEILRKPEDKYNHYIDALRYAHVASMRAKSSGKVYPFFTLENVCFPRLATGEVFVATFMTPGRTLCVATQAVSGGIYVVADFEQRGGVDFAKIRNHFSPQAELTWFPLAKPEEVAANIVQECVDAGLEPSVGQFFPEPNEGALNINQLLQAKQLYICNDCTLTITSLSERVYTRDGELEKNSQQTKVVQHCLLVEYAVYRTLGRVQGEWA